MEAITLGESPCIESVTGLYRFRIVIPTVVYTQYQYVWYAYYLYCNNIMCLWLASYVHDTHDGKKTCTHDTNVAGVPIIIIMMSMQK